MTRMLKPEHLLGCLWDPGSRMLNLPTALADAFKSAVDARSLRGLLEDKGEDGAIGGESEEETLKHFVNRFDGSSARLQLAFLDPHDQLADTSDIILSRLSGGVTCLIDAPCGTGAGFLSLLLTVSRLRELEVLPRVRLDVRLVGADASSVARNIAEALLESVRTTLEDQAIFVEAEWSPWDVASEASTVALNKRAVIKSDGCNSNFLLVANFSGYLIGEKKIKTAAPQLYELFKYFSGDNSVSVWVEPATKAATFHDGMLRWIFSRATSEWAWFARLAKGLGDAFFAFRSEAKFRPILRVGVATVRICVSHMRLTSNDR